MEAFLQMIINIIDSESYTRVDVSTSESEEESEDVDEVDLKVIYAIIMMWGTRGNLVFKSRILSYVEYYVVGSYSAQTF